MSNEQEKRQPIDHKRDASDSQKSVTSQKTANEAVSADTQAKRHSENFESLSHDTKALGRHMRAEQPLVLHDSATGETLYDASKRRSQVSNQIDGELKHDLSKTAGQKIVELERSLQAKRERADHHSSTTKIPGTDARPDGASRQTVRDHNRSETREQNSRRISQATDKVHDHVERGDTTGGESFQPIKQDISVWMPDYKTVGSPMSLPKLVEVHLSPADNARIEELYRNSLGKRAENSVSDFEKQNLKNLAFAT